MLDDLPGCRIDYGACSRELECHGPVQTQGKPQAVVCRVGNVEQTVDGRHDIAEAVAHAQFVDEVVVGSPAFGKMPDEMEKAL